MTSTKETTLFHKLGGRPAVEAVVGNFYERVLADPTLSPFFESTDMDKQRAHQIAFVGMAIGGPNEYQGRQMTEAHAGMGIQDAHFDAVAGYLKAALEWAGVEVEDVDTILGVVGGLRGDVVEVPA